MKMRAIFTMVWALCGWALAAEPAPVLGTPFELAAPAKYRPQYFPGVAWSAGAKAWLVVWQDGDPTADPTGSASAQEILAVRVSADGKVLDEKPIEVCSARGGQQRPVVASDGKGFLVAWHDLRNGKDWDLYAARVTGDGQVLDKGGFPVSAGPHNQCFGAVVLAGGNYFAAWLDMRHWPEYRVYGARVTPDGKVADPGGLELLRPMNDKEMEAWKRAPFAPGKLGKGWHNFGEKGMTGGIKQPGPPAICASGSAVYIANEIEGQASAGVAVCAVDVVTGKPAGEVNRLKDKAGAGLLHWSRPSFAATGEGLLLATHFRTGSWGSGPGTWALARLDPEGKGGEFDGIVTLDSKLPPGYRSYGSRQFVLGVAWDGKRGLFVCEQHEHAPAGKEGPGSPGNIDVQGLLVDASGKRQDAETPFALVTGLATQSAPAVAAGAAGAFLVVWQEETPSQDSRIMARVVDVK